MIRQGVMLVAEPCRVLAEHLGRCPCCSGQRGQDLRAVDTPSSEAFEAGLDGALVSLSWWVITQPTAGGWNQMNFRVLSYLSHSMIL